MATIVLGSNSTARERFKRLTVMIRRDGEPADNTPSTVVKGPLSIRTRVPAGMECQGCRGNPDWIVVLMSLSSFSVTGIGEWLVPTTRITPGVVRIFCPVLNR